MNNETSHQIEAMKLILEQIGDTFKADGVATHFLESLDEQDGSLTIQGNVPGLVYLARCCLDLAQHQIEGKHYFFDVHHMLDKADKDIVLVFKHAPWDKQGDSQ